MKGVMLRAQRPQTGLLQTSPHAPLHVLNSQGAPNSLRLFNTSSAQGHRRGPFSASPCTPAAQQRFHALPLAGAFPENSGRSTAVWSPALWQGPPGGPSPCRHLPSLPRVVPGPMARLLSFLPGSRPSAPHQRGPGPLSATRLALWPGDRSWLRSQAASGSSHLEAPAPPNENHSDHSKQSTHRVHTKSHHPKCRVIITSSHPHKRVCELVVHPFTDEETEAQS